MSSSAASIRVLHSAAPRRWSSVVRSDHGHGPVAVVAGSRTAATTSSTGRTAGARRRAASLKSRGHEQSGATAVGQSLVSQSTSSPSAAAPLPFSFVSALLDGVRKFGASETALQQHYWRVQTAKANTILEQAERRRLQRMAAIAANRTPKADGSSKRAKADGPTVDKMSSSNAKPNNTAGPAVSASASLPPAPPHMATPSSVMSELFDANAHDLVWATYRLALEAGLRTSPADEATALESLQALAAAAATGATDSSPASVANNSADRKSDADGTKRALSSPSAAAAVPVGDAPLLKAPRSRAKVAGIAREIGTADAAAAIASCPLLGPLLGEMPACSNSTCSRALSASAVSSPSDDAFADRGAVSFSEQSSRMLRMLRAVYGDSNAPTGTNATEEWRHPAFSVPLYTPSPCDAYATEVFRRIRSAAAAPTQAASSSALLSATPPVVPLSASTLPPFPLRWSPEDSAMVEGPTSPLPPSSSAVDIIEHVLCRDLFSYPQEELAAAMRGGGAAAFSSMRGASAESSVAPFAAAPDFDAPFLLSMGRHLVAAHSAAALASSASAASTTTESDRFEAMADRGLLARLDDILVGLFLARRGNTTPSAGAASSLDASSYIPGRHSPNRFRATLPAVLGATERLEHIVKRLARASNGGGGGSEGQRRQHRHNRDNCDGSVDAPPEGAGRALVIADSALILAQPRRVVALLERGECIITFATLCRLLEAASAGGALGSSSTSFGGSAFSSSAGTPSTARAAQRQRSERAVAFLQSLLRLRTDYLGAASTTTLSFASDRSSSSAAKDARANILAVLNSGGGSQGTSASSPAVPFTALRGGVTVLGLQEELLLTSLAVTDFGLGNALRSGSSAASPSANSPHASAFLAERRRPHSGAAMGAMAPPDDVRERVSIISAAKAIQLILDDTASGDADGGAAVAGGGAAAAAGGSAPAVSGTAEVDAFFADIGLGGYGDALPTASSPTSGVRGGDPLLHGVQLSIAARDPILLAMAHQHRLHTLHK